MESVKQLELAEGKECYAVIKATNVTVVAVKDGAVNSHVTIKDESDVRISGSITNEAIEQLGLKEGGKAAAIIKSTNVMVTVG